MGTASAGEVARNNVEQVNGVSSSEAPFSVPETVGFLPCTDRGADVVSSAGSMGYTRPGNTLGKAV